ncbi:hypothetical protein B0H10DRAFT_1954604 [Mycena sp. CBHHK59/15]|nr:hypothetical protein B0H10DRAFT_1954604 [Mycena sp. CBHHK59/15]
MIKMIIDFVREGLASSASVYMGPAFRLDSRASQEIEGSARTCESKEKKEWSIAEAHADGKMQRRARHDQDQINLDIIRGSPVNAIVQPRICLDPGSETVTDRNFFNIAEADSEKHAGTRRRTCTKVEERWKEIQTDASRKVDILETAERDKHKPIVMREIRDRRYRRSHKINVT